MALTEGVVLLLGGVPAVMFAAFTGLTGGSGLLRTLGLSAAIVTIGVLLLAAARALALRAVWARWTIAAAQCVVVVGAAASVPLHAVSSWPLWAVCVVGALIALHGLVVDPLTRDVFRESLAVQSTPGSAGPPPTLAASAARVAGAAAGIVAAGLALGVLAFGGLALALLYLWMHSGAG